MRWQPRNTSAWERSQPISTRGGHSCPLRHKLRGDSRPRLSSRAGTRQPLSIGEILSAHGENQPHLKRVLGRFDLVLLFVVAVFNLNVVPSIAANGGVTVWLWIISLLLFSGRKESR